MHRVTNTGAFKPAMIGCEPAIDETSGETYDTPTIALTVNLVFNYLLMFPNTQLIEPNMERYRSTK